MHPMPSHTKLKQLQVTHYAPSSAQTDPLMWKCHHPQTTELSWYKLQGQGVALAEMQAQLHKQERVIYNGQSQLFH